MKMLATIFVLLSSILVVNEASATQCQYQVDGLPAQSLPQVSATTVSLQDGPAVVQPRMWQDRILVIQNNEGTAADVLSGDRLKAYLATAYVELQAAYDQEKASIAGCYGWCAKSPKMGKNMKSAIVTINVDGSAGRHYIYDIVSSGTDDSSFAGPTKELQIPALGYGSVLKSSSLKITCQD